MPQPQLETITLRLVELEQVIDRGRQGFLDVGNALMEIRDDRLYKGRGYPSFDDYVRKHLGFQRTYAQHLINGAKAVAEIAEVTMVTPANERQARELARAPEGERGEVWQKVVESREPVTAARVRAVVEQKTPRQLPSAEETFRGMLTSAVSYGVVVAEVGPEAVRRMFEEALRAALRDLADMS